MSGCSSVVLFFTGEHLFCKLHQLSNVIITFQIREILIPLNFGQLKEAKLPADMTGEQG